MPSVKGIELIASSEYRKGGERATSAFLGFGNSSV
jgi:hypothetical protein